MLAWKIGVLTQRATTEECGGVMMMKVGEAEQRHWNGFLVHGERWQRILPALGAICQ